MREGFQEEVHTTKSKKPSMTKKFSPSKKKILYDVDWNDYHASNGILAFTTLKFAILRELSVCNLFIKSIERGSQLWS